MPVTIDGRTYRLRVRRLDNALSARRSAENVRRAIADDAVAVIDDGIGVNASWRLAEREHLPIGITYAGGSGLVDEETRPNVFRIAPRDRGIAFRLAEYLIPKGLRIALVHDSSGYGRAGAEALDEAFGRNPEAVATRVALASAGDVTRRCSPRGAPGRPRSSSGRSRLGARRDRRSPRRAAAAGRCPCTHAPTAGRPGGAAAARPTTPELGGRAHVRVRAG